MHRRGNPVGVESMVSPAQGRIEDPLQAAQRLPSCWDRYSGQGFSRQHPPQFVWFLTH